MVAHIRPGDIVVTLTRLGNEVDSHRAPTPERALKVALLMLATQDALYPGDALRVDKAN